MAKFYAVKEGKKPGIYMSWDECKEQVNGYSGAVYKSFTSEDEAKAFIGKEVKKIKLNFQALFFYTHCFFSQPISNFIIIIPTMC